MENKYNTLKKEISECYTLVEMLKNVYNSSVADNEKLTEDDINAVFNLILEKLGKIKSL